MPKQYAEIPKQKHGRLDFDVRSLNPPAPLLQETTVLGKPKHIVRNEMENGYTERHFIYQTYLTEPPGIIKIPKLFLGMTSSVDFPRHS